MRGLEHLIPEAQREAERFLTACKEQGLNVLITDTLRTQKEQDALYAQGRTTPGNIVTSVKFPNSPHCWGIAWDFCHNIRGAEYDNADGFFEKVGAVAESLGLVWGGHFNRPDRPHIQLARYLPDKTTAELVKAYHGDPNAFIAEKIQSETKSTESEKAKIAELREMLIKAITPDLAAEIIRIGNARLALEQVSTEWEGIALAWASKNHVFKGDPSGALMGRKLATRAEVAEMLRNYDYTFKI